MAKCKAQFGTDVCHAKNGDACMQSFCPFTQSYREPKLDKEPDPTPAELAQQLADLIGLQVTVFKTQSDTSRFVLGDNATSCGSIFINRPVDWSNTKDSKVTATPKEVTK